MKPASTQSAIVAIGIGTLLAAALVAFGTAVVQNYGWAVFGAAPLVCGTLVGLVYAWGTKPRVASLAGIASIAGTVALFTLLLLGQEGLICIIMALPIVLPLYVIGGICAWSLLHLSRSDRARNLCVLFGIGLTPLWMGLEGRIHNPTEIAVRTAVSIDAEPAIVWREVIAFTPIPEPREWWFRAGIAYPTHAEIRGSGVGAVRLCHFSTGAFVEPITVWEENELLAFDVAEQPLPMIEISPWDIHPPHLDSAVRSQRGMFELERTADGHTRLTGTTWITVHMMPHAYWSAVTAWIVHRIHLRVLHHIQRNAEA
ncbi:hypothetical protein ASA1KI_44480 [Opitutales bacterium ASA1]|uniref:hypothetical protein n=1 Tax=Congregicoccus parvus TaxID=3081749 RepID=UPI002B2D9172|nr:hypothetical protein ASA1KI_44480 [Opitutales bacterium ASA1]